MSNRIAYLTLSDIGDFFVYDSLTVQPLAELGWLIEDVAWDEPGVDWGRFAAVVIRSTWDYQDRADEFLDVLDAIEAASVPLLNNAKIVRWNLRKTYLRELAGKGVPTVPTVWTPAGKLSESIFENEGRGPTFASAAELVVKPIIGANADDTYRLGPGDETAWRQAREAFAERPSMVQPFLHSIVEEGEYSLFYFGGEYSHCVLKRPMAGDFRVQEEHGGSVASVEPSAAMRSVGEHAVASLPETTLYARVDLVRLDDATYAVIEVELIEPSLYFPFDEDSPRRFAAVVDSTLRRLQP